MKLLVGRLQGLHQVVVDVAPRHRPEDRLCGRRIPPSSPLRSAIRASPADAGDPTRPGAPPSISSIHWAASTIATSDPRLSSPSARRSPIAARPRSHAVVPAVAPGKLPLQARQGLGVVVDGEHDSALLGGNALHDPVVGLPMVPTRAPRVRPERTRIGARIPRPTSVLCVGRLRVEIGVLLGAASLVLVPPSVAAGSSLYGGPAPAGPRHPLREPARAPQLRNPGCLARQADPRLGRQRLPRGRVPLPGLPLRRPRRQGSARDPGDPRAAGDTFSRRTAPTPTRPIRPTRATPPTSSSCASSRWRTATAFRITLNTLKDPDAGRRRRSRSAARRSRASSRTAPTPPRRRSSSSPSTATSADLIDAADRPAVAPAAAVTVSTRRRQIEVSVPHSRLEPGPSDGPAGRRRRPLGRGRRAATCCRGAAADATHPGRRRGAWRSGGVLQRRLPLRTSRCQRPTHRTRCSPTRPGGATASRATALAARRPRARSTPRSTSASSRAA